MRLCMRVMLSTAQRRKERYRVKEQGESLELSSLRGTMAAKKEIRLKEEVLRLRIEHTTK